MTVRTGQNVNAYDLNLIDHFVAGESISSGDAVSLNYSDYKIYKASASALDHRLNFIGFAMEAGTENNAIEVNVRTVVNEKSGLTANTIYYLSNTQGAISTSAGTYERIIGRSISTSRIIRKRGVVSKPISVSSGIAPCDGLIAFTNNDAGTNEITVSGQVMEASSNAMTVPVGMGQTFSADLSGTDVYWFVILDFGGYY